MELTIKLLNGQTSSLRVCADATVGELKNLISQHFEVATSKQKLSADNGHRISLNDDSKTLSEYGLHSGSMVSVLITPPASFQVFLKNEKGELHTYDVSPGETVTQFKAKVHNKERVPADQQRLIHNGRQLEDGGKLEDYNIVTQSTIHLTMRLRGG